MKRFLASLFISGLFTFSCTDKCGDVNPYFDITGLQVSSQASQPQDGNALTYNPKDSIRFEDFYIAGMFDHFTYANQLGESGVSFIPAALATDCIGPGDAGSKEKITAVEVTALSDYSTAFPANSKITNIVRIDQRTIPAYIENSKEYGIKERGLQFTFTLKPENPDVKQAFRIKLVLENGETYTAETQPVKLF